MYYTMYINEYTLTHVYTYYIRILYQDYRLQYPIVMYTFTYLSRDVNLIRLCYNVLLLISNNNNTISRDISDWRMRTQLYT